MTTQLQQQAIAAMTNGATTTQAVADVLGIRRADASGLLQSLADLGVVEHTGTTQTWALTRLGRAVEAAKAEVVALVNDETVPGDVTGFSDLHDYIDANELGGACDDERNGSATFRDEEAWHEFVGALQDRIDGWLQDGRPGEYGERVRVEEADPAQGAIWRLFRGLRPVNGTHYRDEETARADADLLNGEPSSETLATYAEERASHLHAQVGIVTDGDLMLKVPQGAARARAAVPVETARWWAARASLDTIAAERLRMRDAGFAL